MEHEHFSPENKLTDKELVSQWQVEFQQGIEEMRDDPNATLESAARLAFEKGILARVAPEDPAVMEARKKLRRTVYEGGRDNDELYLRILVALEHMRDAIRNVRTLGADFVAPVTQVYANMMREGQERFFGDKPKEDPMELFFGKLEELARAEIQGEQKAIPPVGGRFSYKDHEFVVGRYTTDGLLQPDTDDYEMHRLVGELTADTGHIGSISPAEIDFEQD